MVSVHDVVRAVAQRGAATFVELEAALPDDPGAFLRVLDACVDHGYLRLVLRRGVEHDLPYRVTARGQRLLQAAGQAAAAA